MIFKSDFILAKSISISIHLPYNFKSEFFFVTRIFFKNKNFSVSEPKSYFWVIEGMAWRQFDYEVRCNITKFFDVIPMASNAFSKLNLLKETKLESDSFAKRNIELKCSDNSDNRWVVLGSAKSFILSTFRLCFGFRIMVLKHWLAFSYFLSSP